MSITSRVVLLSVILLAALSTKSVFAANFTAGNATLSNSRFSYKAAINTGGLAGGSTTVSIKTSGYSDNNTDNIFPGDILCFNGNTGDGCRNQTTHTVTSIPSTSSIGFTAAISGAMLENDWVVSSQSGTLTVTFTPATSVLSGGSIVLTLPAASSNAADGIPDSTGFDAADLPANLISGTCSGTTCFAPTSFTASAVSLSTGASLQTITITLSSALTAGNSYSFRLGSTSDATLRFLNPTPSGTSHVRGVADTYGVSVTTDDTVCNPNCDSSTFRVAPIDGVLVSANVELSLTYYINQQSTTYVNGSSQVAGGTAITECSSFTTSSGVTSTPTAVPFGSILNYDTFYQTAQTHSIVTNAPAGYSLTVLTNRTNGSLYDAATGTVELPITGTNNCDGSCSTTAATAWATPANNGFAYTVGGITNATDASGAQGFNAAGGNYKLFDSSTARAIMGRTTPTSLSRAATCYRLSVGNTQTAGLYTAKLTYVATPNF